MGKDWEFVAGDLLDETDVTTVQLLAGLNPNNAGQCSKLRKALGLSIATLKQYERENGKNSESIESCLSDEEDDEDGEVTEIKNPLCYVGSELSKRIGIYQRLCSLKRSLLSPPLITSKRVIYNELNIIICHVSIWSDT
jgi:hypothetical protein